MALYVAPSQRGGGSEPANSSGSTELLSRLSRNVPMLAINRLADWAECPHRELVEHCPRTSAARLTAQRDSVRNFFHNKELTDSQQVPVARLSKPWRHNDVRLDDTLHSEATLRCTANPAESVPIRQSRRRAPPLG